MGLTLHPKNKILEYKILENKIYSRYRAFMAMFGPLPRHLVLNSQNSCLGSEAVHRTQHKLHLLDPDIFPLLRDVSVPAVWNAHPPVPKTNSPVRLKGLEELKNKVCKKLWNSDTGSLYWCFACFT